MKNLTQKQQEIMLNLEQQFSEINKYQSIEDTNDLFKYINAQIDVKKKFIDDITITNAVYDEAIESQVRSICDSVDNLLTEYGYKITINPPIRNGCGVTYCREYTAEISWYGHKTDTNRTETKTIYFKANIGNIHNVPYLVDSSVRIFDGYKDEDRVKSVDDLMKSIANMIIAKKKSLIK